MPPTTGHKRRRAEPEDSTLLATVERDAEDIRRSLHSLYDQLPVLGDLTVRVEGEHDARDFPVIGAVLASASRPLHAMLFGPMRAASVGPDAPRAQRKLRLSGTEPWCFELMLQFVHGCHISLTEDTAVRLHHVADYYEVLPLRDACCRFLLDAIRSYNCCGLLMRSHDINCEPLTQRCLDTLTLDFVAVVDSDDGFPELAPSELQTLAQSDRLVCAEELEVLHALLKWYTHGSSAGSAEKLEALLELLPLVRWARISAERRKAALEAVRAAAALAAHAAHTPHTANAACASGDGDERDGSRGARKVARRESAATGRVREERATHLSTPCHAPDDESEQNAGARAGLALERRVLALLEQCPPLCPMVADAPRATPPPRCYTWGTLVGRNPEPPAAPQLTQDTQSWRLESTKEYKIGRSRRSDIRIGHNAPMPYISSQHFRVYNQIRWPDDALAAGGAGSSAAAGGAREAPHLEAWLEDLSQNGTFINGTLVGRDKKRRLDDGDKIELVFPQESAPRSPNSANHFPVFTFHATRPIEERPTPAAGDVSDASGYAIESDVQPTSPDDGAAPSSPLPDDGAAPSSPGNASV